MSRSIQTLLQVTNKPQLILPDKAAIILQVLADRANIEVIGLEDRPKVEAFSDERTIYNRNKKRGTRPYAVQDGVAIIEVSGTLRHRWGSARPSSGATGYDGLGANLKLALEDREVKGIFLDIDSPGGEVAGCFDFCDKLFEAQKQKPVVALAADLAASAAYAIASQAGQIYVTQTAQVGSIGVVMAHIDQSAFMEKHGLKVTLLHSGQHKVDGNGLEALPDTVRADMQRDLDRSRALFVDKVARGRGLSSQSIFDTEARVYGPQDALAMNLADGIGHPDAVFEAFVKTVNQRTITVMTPEQKARMEANLDGGDASVAPNENQTADVQNVPAAQRQNANVQDALAVAQLGADKGFQKTGFALANLGLSQDKASQVLAAVEADTEPMKQAAADRAAALAKAEAAKSDSAATRDAKAFGDMLTRQDQPEVSADLDGDDTDEKPNRLAAARAVRAKMLKR